MVLLLLFMQLTRDLFAIAKFLFNVRQCIAHVIDIGFTSVGLSVRHTLVLCRNGLTYRQTVFTAW